MADLTQTIALNGFRKTDPSSVTVLVDGVEVFSGAVADLDDLSCFSKKQITTSTHMISNLIITLAKQLNFTSRSYSKPYRETHYQGCKC